MKQYSDTELLEGLKTNNNKVLRYIYSEYFPYVENFVAQHGGSSDNAKDVFQDAMIVLFNKASADRLHLFCKFGTYLFAICKKIWLQEKKKELRHLDKLKEMHMVAEKPAQYGDQTISDARAIFEKHFDKLGPDCKTILSLSFNGASIEDIRKALGYKSVHNVSDKKYRCKKELTDNILNDPLYKKIKK